MTAYFRPLVSADPVRPAGALPIAGGWTWATHAERIERGGARTLVPVADIPAETANRLSAPRPDVAGLSMGTPRLMGILNATPDSFSDGGLHYASDSAIAAGKEMLDQGIDILDIGGESTRPGAEVVPPEEEIRRTLPIVEALAASGARVSIDTRKAPVARAALSGGAAILNDVSALTHDADMAATAAASDAPVILMHAQGDPKTMQDAPAYDDVLLDVYDALAGFIATAEAAGIPRARIAVDPGIGFGKTIDHNLALLAGLSLFHGLGCPILLGASRKRFIGAISGAHDPADRMPGSVAVALHAIGQGVQMIRVHDTLATKQALSLWTAMRGQ